MFALQHELQLCYGSEGIAKIAPFLMRVGTDFRETRQRWRNRKGTRNEEPVSKARILFAKH
jgi:hypothetical protein